MSDEVKALAVGEEETRGGEGTTDIVVPARNHRQRVDLIAYHNGFGGGGSTAGLLLSMDGTRLGNPEDRNFENYYLELRRTVILERDKSASFRAAFTNSGATTTIRGLIATIRHV